MSIFICLFAGEEIFTGAVCVAVGCVFACPLFGLGRILEHGYVMYDNTDDKDGEQYRKNPDEGCHEVKPFKVKIGCLSPLLFALSLTCRMFIKPILFVWLCI